jgi:enamine deaminase RidA (YjgF/YER057c/UK114 family)
VTIEARLHELGLELPTLPPPVAKYVPAVRVGDLVWASGATPTIDGVLVISGKLGAEVTVEQGRDAARLAALNCLAGAMTVIDSLGDIARIVKLNGYVASAEGFADQPKVINGASELLEQIFGASGKHARTAVGVAELPGHAPVEVEMTLQLKS